ncbi:MAG: recombinase family protein [Candidatus Eisenbacteria bacterium]
MKPAPPKSTVVRCAIYTRKSTDEGLEQSVNSLDAQREAAEAFIASQKHEGCVALSERYDDGGYSGGSMERPGLRRLLAEVDAGRVDVIVVYKVDRLSRSLLDFARIIGRLDEKKVAFVSVTQQFNTSTPMGKLTLNVLMSFAEFERGVISERTRDKMAAARRKGKWTGGPPLLGYDIHPDGGRLLVNDAEAAQVREVFQVYLEAESLSDVVREVTRRGIRTKRWTTRRDQARGGEPFDKGALHRLLRSRLYLGQVDFGGSIYAGEHPAIVDEAVWQQAQRLLARNSRAGGRAVRNKNGAILVGLLHCAACDAPMSHTYSQRGPRRWRYYGCRRKCPSGSLPAREIEAFVVERVRGIGGDPKVLAQLPAEARDAVREFTPVWEVLPPRRQVRLLHLLIERVTYDARTETVSVTYRENGIAIAENAA